MVVLHLIDRFNPNLGQEINFIAKNKDFDLNLIILTSKSLKPWGIIDFKQVEAEDIRYRDILHVSIIRKEVLFEFGEKLWLKNVVKEINIIKPEVVYVHGIEYLTFIRIILWYSFKRDKNFALFTDTHSLPVFTQGNLFRKVYYTFLSKLIIPLVNKYHIKTFYTAEENRFLLEKIYGVTPSLILPFLIGADLKTFIFNPEERIAKRSHLNICENEVLIVFTGRICIQKGPHLILEVLHGLKAKLTRPVSILLIGFQEVSYVEKKLKPLIESSFRVFIEMAKPSYLLPAYFSAADFAVFPLENTLSSLECQACRLPVLMEDNPTNHQRAKMGGLLYEKGNITDMGVKMLQLINDSSLRHRLSEDGYTYVSKNYDYLRNLRQMEDILREHA